MAIDRAVFFHTIRPLFGGTLRQTQVDGMDSILNGWERRAPEGDIRWLAYMFATAFHETNRTMQPVREAYWLSEQWRRNNLRYYPYYGRGYVQLTWRENYERAGGFVGVDLARDPDLALDPENAAIIMFVGMEQGWFRRDPRGRQELARYFNSAVNDPVGAREIINGREVKVINGRRVLLAKVIASYHDAFLRAVAAAIGREERLVAEAFTPMEAGGFAEAPAFETAFATPETVAAEMYGAEPDSAFFIDRTVDIVTAYLHSNAIDHSDVPRFIAGVHAALAELVGPPPGYAGLEDSSDRKPDGPHIEAPAKARKAARGQSRATS